MYFGLNTKNFVIIKKKIVLLSEFKTSVRMNELPLRIFNSLITSGYPADIHRTDHQFLSSG